MLPTIVIIAVVALIIIYVTVSYNSLIKYRNWVEESWTQIDVQLRRRYNLIPNLVNTVKGYAEHEQETLDKVVSARSQIVSGTPNERVEADNSLQSSLKSIFALQESYPDLKANKNFLELQDELASTENKIAYSRQLYNSSVAEFNIKRAQFPTVVISNIFNFEKRELLTTPEEMRETPTVSF